MIVHVPIDADPIILPASATFTSIPTVGAATYYATTNMSTGPAGTTSVFSSASYISPNPAYMIAVPITTSSGGKVTSTTTKPYCAVVTMDSNSALACAPEVEAFLGKLWLQGSFKRVTKQPAAATMISNAWSNSIISKRGAETGASYALAWIFAAGVSAGKTCQKMFGHGPVWDTVVVMGLLLYLPHLHLYLRQHPAKLARCASRT